MSAKRGTRLMSWRHLRFRSSVDRVVAAGRRVGGEACWPIGVPLSDGMPEAELRDQTSRVLM
jgi:hypothetical protein